jgi:hypothetical protein
MNTEAMAARAQYPGQAQKSAEVDRNGQTDHEGGASTRHRHVDAEPDVLAAASASTA